MDRLNGMILAGTAGGAAVSGPVIHVYQSPTDGTTRVVLCNTADSTLYETALTGLKAVPPAPQPGGRGRP